MFISCLSDILRCLVGGVVAVDRITGSRASVNRKPARAVLKPNLLKSSGSRARNLDILLRTQCLKADV